MPSSTRSDRNSNQSVNNYNSPNNRPVQNRSPNNNTQSQNRSNTNPNQNESSNPIDEFLEWLEHVDVPSLTPWQKVLVYGVCFVLVVVIITSFTGHAYTAAVAFVKAIDGLSTPILTIIVMALVIIFEIIGVNTTLLALAVGYVYGRRYSTLDATIFASIVSFVSVCIGCLVAYFLGSTVLLDWALELQRRNEVFEAIDHVLGEQGLKVNLLLRLTLPDCLINYSMGCSQCTILDFIGGFLTMIPWIVAHAWYGAQIESLTDKVGNKSDDLITLIVGIVATTLLSVLLIYWTKKELKKMLENRNNNGDEESIVIPDHRAYRNSGTGGGTNADHLNNELQYFTPAYLELHEQINANQNKPPPQNNSERDKHRQHKKKTERKIGGGNPRGANGNNVEMM